MPRVSREMVCCAGSACVPEAAAGGVMSIVNAFLYAIMEDFAFYCSCVSQQVL